MTEHLWKTLSSYFQISSVHLPLVGLSPTQISPTVLFSILLITCSQACLALPELGAYFPINKTTFSWQPAVGDEKHFT